MVGNILIVTVVHTIIIRRHRYLAGVINITKSQRRRIALPGGRYGISRLHPTRLIRRITRHEIFHLGTGGNQVKRRGLRSRGRIRQARRWQF